MQGQEHWKIGLLTTDQIAIVKNEELEEESICRQEEHPGTLFLKPLFNVQSNNFHAYKRLTTLHMKKAVNKDKWKDQFGYVKDFLNILLFKIPTNHANNYLYFLWI